MTHHTIPKKVSISVAKLNALRGVLSHDGKVIVPFYYEEEEKDGTKFDLMINTKQ